MEKNCLVVLLWSFWQISVGLTQDTLPILEDIQGPITQVEYFLDADPGFGNGTPLPITPVDSIENLMINIQIDTLSDGFHRFSIRSRDDLGKWSILSDDFFFITELPTLIDPSGPIANMEYFFDIDPGFGNGTPLTVTPGDSVTDLMLNVQIDTLPDGFHRFHIRSQDALGKWSIVSEDFFFISKLPNLIDTSGPIVAMEYFLDADPGFGNGIPLTITSGDSVEDLMLNVQIDTLPDGFHRFQIRSRDALGKWSIVSDDFFIKGELPTFQIDSSKLVSGEYFFNGSDPGFGHANLILIEPDTDDAQLSLSFDLEDIPDFNTIHFRSRTESGKWSLTEYSTPTCPALDVVLNTQAEVDTFVITYSDCDSLPVNLTIQGNNDIQNLSGLDFLVDIQGQLAIRNSHTLINLSGFQNLRSVGSLRIESNNMLDNLGGLDSLCLVHDQLLIYQNDVLSNLDGLTKLDSVGGALTITNNPNLTNCDGICHILQNERITGTISIYANPSPCSSETEIRIFCADAKCPSGDVSLQTQTEVDAFTSAFFLCDSIPGNLIIEGGNSISDLTGLTFITHVLGDLVIRNSYQLSDLKGFDQLTKIQGDLRIENTRIDSLGFLDSLTAIGGDFRIFNNDSLTFINGLNQLLTIGADLIIQNNATLMDCSGLCQLINQSSIGGTLNVSNNPFPCNTAEEIQALCIYGTSVAINIEGIADSVMEGDTINFDITVSSPPLDTLVISLSSSDILEAPVIPTVNILPGQISAVVSIIIPDDALGEINEEIIITAGAPYLTAARDTFVIVNDNDIPGITFVVFLDTISESAGTYATEATVSRLLDDGSPIIVRLESNSNEVILPDVIELEPDELEESFYVGFTDNAIVDGYRQVELVARIELASCNCGAEPPSIGYQPQVVTVIDDDGPALSLSLSKLSMKEGLSNAGILTISRNTATSTELDIALSVSDTSELTLPGMVTIPIGSTSIDVVVTTKPDALMDGNQQVSIKANATGHASGSIWAIVTDINKPDLSISRVEVASNTTESNGFFPFQISIGNNGFSAAPTGVDLIGYLSSDLLIDESDFRIGQYTIDISIAADDTIEYVNLGNTPSQPGPYYLIFEINTSRSFTELLYVNNVSEKVPVSVLPDFHVTANVEDSVFFMGETVRISGASFSTDSMKVPNTGLTVRVINDSFQKAIQVTTDSAGNYVTSYSPYDREAGHFLVGIGSPTLDSYEIQDSFDILGVNLDNGNGDFIVWDLILDDTINATITVENISNIDLTNLTIQPMDLPEGLHLVFDTLPVLPGGATVALDYEILGTQLTNLDDYIRFPLQIVSSQDNIQTETAYYFCQAQSGFLRSDVPSINTTVNKDQPRQIEFQIFNTGAGSSGEISVDIPQVDWMRLATAEVMPSLLSGDTGIVIIELIPGDNLPLNTPASGNIAIQAANGNTLMIPFRLEKVSDVTGGLLIDVIDQFTYFTDEAPHVANARVRISHYFTGELFAEGFTDENGLFAVDSLPEGKLRIVVDAEKHRSYDNLITVAPGLQRTEVIFLEYQAISFSWDVVPTTVEDEYEVNLVMEFETNVPVPVVLIDMPEEVPELVDDETFSFFITLTNVGLITAQNVQLILPEDPEYEFLTNYEPQDLLAQQSIQIPVTMKRIPGQALNSNLSNYFLQASDLLGIEEPAIANVPQSLPCKAITITIYGYECGSNGLWQQTATEFDYQPRTCSSSGSGSPTTVNENPRDIGPGGDSRPTKCLDCSRPYGFDSFIADIPVPNIGCDCNDCVKKIILEALSCIPNTIGSFASVAGCAIDPSLECFVGLIKAEINQGITCAKDPLSVKCAAPLVAKAIVKRFPIAACIIDLIPTAQECGYVPGGSSGLISEFELTSNGTFPAELQPVLDDLNALKVLINSKEQILREYYGDLIENESLFELASVTEPFIINEEPIKAQDSIDILSRLELYDFDLNNLNNFITNWNETIFAWSIGIFSPTQNYPNIVDKALLYAYQLQIENVQDYVETRGYEELTDLVADALLFTASVNIDPNSTPPNASFNFDPVCASVSIEINQRLTMTREAFEGTLTVFNGHPDLPLENFNLNLEIKNEDGIVSNGLFEIETIELNSLTEIDGTGELAAESEGFAKILFIPERGAAPTLPTIYSFGGSISYLDPFSGLMVTVPLIPVTITVNPSPDLFLHYFMPRDIYADDPLTVPVEPIIPAEFAVMIENNGYGVAQNVIIETAQPEIIDNEKGLAVRFNLVGSQFQGQPKNLGLTSINFGNIQPLKTKIGQWYFTSSLLGHFTGFETNLVHLDSRGNPDLSLISGVELHELAHSISVYNGLDDGINDFLVNEIPDAQDIPDAIYLSQGNSILPVYQAVSGLHTGEITAPGHTTTLEVDPLGMGWNYIKTDDPGSGNFEIISITRNSDGQVIPLSNAWLTHVTIPDGGVQIYEDKFHFVDDFTSFDQVTYTIVWSPIDPNPPEVLYITGAPGSVTAHQVENLIVTFSEPIIDSTFTVDDLSLHLQGGPNLIDGSVMITKLDSTSYMIDISSITIGNGFYVFTAQAAGIKDATGINGLTGKQVAWTQFLSVPAIQEYIGLPENLIASQFDTVRLLFNLPIDTSSLRVNSFAVLLDSIVQSGSFEIAQVDTTNRLFTLSGLGSFMSIDGAYTLEVDLRHIKSIDSVYGLAVQQITMILDTQGPALTNLVRMNQGGLDAQHFTGMILNFDEGIPPFDTSAFEIKKNGIALNADPIEVKRITDNWYEIHWNQAATYSDGLYEFTIDMTKVLDFAQNPGLGQTTQTWVVNRSSSLTASNLGIDPDLGFSSTDGITSTKEFNFDFSINQTAKNIEIFQNDNGTLVLLKELASLDVGQHNIPVVLPTGGMSALLLKMEDTIGNEVSEQLPIYIDESALSGTWKFTKGLNVASTFDSIDFEFDARISNTVVAVDSVISVSRSNNIVDESTLVLTNTSDTTKRLSGLEPISNIPGRYKVGIDLRSFEKRSSGITGRDFIETEWTLIDNNRAPEANAGVDIAINKLGFIALDASASIDPDQDQLAYRWYPPFGKLLNDPVSSSPLVEILPSDDGRVLTFLLEVSDGKLTSTDIVRVTVSIACTESDIINILSSEKHVFLSGVDSLIAETILEVESPDSIGLTTAYAYDHCGPYRVDSSGQPYMNQDIVLDILDPNLEYGNTLEVRIYVHKDTLQRYLDSIEGINSLDDILVAYSPVASCTKGVLRAITDTLSIIDKSEIDSDWYAIDFLSPGQGTFHLFGTACPRIKFVSIADRSIYTADQEITINSIIPPGSGILLRSQNINIVPPFEVGVNSTFEIEIGNCDP